MRGHVRRLGLVEYEDALRLLEYLVQARQRDRIPDQLLFVEHPHIFTLGRRAKLEHVLIDEVTRREMGVQLHESVRGGDVTYHGPGQVVMYPVVALLPARQDLVRYVRDLEEVMIRTVGDYGVTAGRIEGLSGCWVGGDKIGAIGVRMARWVTSHGIALNVNTDLSFFGRIVPCGIRDHGVTSLQRLAGRPVDPEEVRGRLQHHFQTIFGIELEAPPPARRSVQVVIARRAARLELLCLRRVAEKGGFWQPVTGHVEEGEGPLEAAAREAREETGLSGAPVDLEYVHCFMLDPAWFGDGEPRFYEEHSYLIEVPAEAQVRLEPESHDKWRWLPLEEAVALVQWPGNREGMRRAARYLEANR